MAIICSGLNRFPLAISGSFRSRSILPINPVQKEPVRSTYRRLAVTVTTFTTAAVNVRILNGEGRIIDEELFRGGVKSGAIVARFQSAPGYWTAGTEVY